MLHSYNYTNEKRKKDEKNHARNQKKEKTNANQNSKKKQRTSKKEDIDFEKPMLIAGGLKSFGWGVYEGIDVSEEKFYPVIDELERSINTRGYGNAWQSIPNPGQNGEQNMLKIQRKKMSFQIH